MLWCGGILVLLTTVLAFPPEKLSLDADWEAWKTTYRKEYSSREEEELRRSVWEKKMLLIKVHNQEYKRGLHSFKMGMNHLGDMTTEEVTEKMTGLIVPQKRERNNTLTLNEFPTKLPKYIDYRRWGWVTPVRNQGTCNACWAFSAAGALEGQLMKTRGQLVSLSPQNLVDCSSRFGNKGCKGGHMIFAYDYMAKKGIDSEKMYPYVGKDQNCTYNSSDKVAQIWRFVMIPQGNERALKAAVAKYGPVAVGISAGHQSFIHYTGGVYFDQECNEDNINHAALVVGYGVTCDCEKYWIIKNSWGQGWGENGYIRMARNRGNLCGIASEASVPLL